MKIKFNDVEMNLIGDHRIDISGDKFTIGQITFAPTPVREVISPLFLHKPLPRIGEAWPGQGGIFTGIARGRDGKPDYALITGPRIDAANGWDRMKELVAALEADGHKDFTLPFRAEQALQFANLADLFNKYNVYWSCEQHAADSYDAWTQNFNDGGQGYWYEDGKLLGCGVRRLPI